MPLKLILDPSGIVEPAARAKDALDRIALGAQQAQDKLKGATPEVQKQAAAYDALRLKLDGAYAAEKQYAAAVDTVNLAVKSGLASQEQANQILDQARAKYLGVAVASEQAAAGAVAGRIAQNEANAIMARGASGANLFAGASRNLGQQLSQVGQQTMVTGNFIQALAIQLPDIGLAFGSIGIAVGLFAGIALPLLASAFGKARDTVNQAQDALDAYGNSFQALRDDMSAATALQNDYVAAVQSGNAKVIAAIQQEAGVRKALTALDLADAVAKKEAAKTAQDAEAAVIVASAAAQDKMVAQVKKLYDAQELQRQASAKGLSASGVDYQSQLDAAQGLLEKQTAELNEQLKLHERSSLEYQLINAQVAQLQGRMEDINALQAAIADGTAPIAGGLERVNSAISSFASRLTDGVSAMGALISSQPGGGWLQTAISRRGRARRA